MTNAELITVVFVADETVAPPLAVAIRSLVAATGPAQLEIVVIDGGLSLASRLRCATAGAGKLAFVAPRTPAAGYRRTMARASGFQRVRDGERLRATLDAGALA